MEGRPQHQHPDELFADWLAKSGTEEELEALCSANREHSAALRELLRSWRLLAPIVRRAGFGLVLEHGHSFAERLKQEYGSGVDPAIALEKEREEGGPPTSALLRRLSEHGLRRSRYALKGELARGGMGAILKVWDEDLRRSLAMKVILGKTEGTSGETPPVDRRLLARFLEEAQVTGQLDHPGIVPVHELGLDAEGRVYFTMKLVKGRDLRAIFELVFAGQEGWNETRALGVLLKVCEAMAYAHAKGVIHRDLKPANVMVGGFGEVYVMDWGLARVLGRADQHDLRLREAETPLTSVKTERREEREEAPDSPLFTMDGDVVGTPAYMPPEQALGAVERLSPRSDVYAIGAMLYHLLARHMPYVPAGGRMTNRMVLAAVTQRPPAPLASLRRDAPAELVAIVERAMAREPELRYRDTLELAEDLRAYLEHRVVAAYETGAWAETKKWVQRNKPLASSLAAAVLLLIVGLTASLVFKAQADERAADLLTANTTIRQREAESQKARGEADDRAREARASLYVAAVTGAQSARHLNEPASVRRLLDSAPEELRNWEWAHLNAASDSSLLTLPISSEFASFSPDGTQILTLSPAPNACSIWDATTGHEVLRLVGHSAEVASAAFDPDGARVVTASADRTARLWDGRTGQEVGRLEGHRDKVSSASFSPDGLRVLTVSRDGMARIWDVGSLKVLVELAGQGEHKVVSADYSLDGCRIIGCGWSGTYLWDTASGAELLRLDQAALFSPYCLNRDGTLLLNLIGFTPVLSDPATGSELVRMEGHSGQVMSASFSEDGSRVLTSSVDQTARVWDAASGKELVKLVGHTSTIGSACFSRDGQQVLTASDDNTLRIWDTASGTERFRLQGHTRPVHSARYSPDGTRIISTGLDKTVRVWDSNTLGNPVALLGNASGEVSLAWFSPDGARLLTADFFDSVPHLWDASTGALLARLEGHESDVTCAAFRGDGLQIATGAIDRTMRIWDAVSGAQLAQTEQGAAITSVEYSPDGSRIAIGGADGFTHFVDSKSLEEVGHLSDLAGSKVAFGPDGSRMALSEGDSVRILDLASGTQTRLLTGSTDGAGHLCFGPDGAQLVATSGAMKFHEGTVDTPRGDAITRIWDVSSGELVAQLEGHTARVTSVCYSADGSRLVTASDDKTVRVWNPATGDELLRLEGSGEGLQAVAFSRDGSRILAVSKDGKLDTWDSVPHHVVIECRAAAETAASDALERGGSFDRARSILCEDKSLQPPVRRQALDVLGEYATKVLLKQRERAWLLRLIGRESWPSEDAVEAQLSTAHWVPKHPTRLNDMAWSLVDPDIAPTGLEVRALLLARRAIAASQGGVAPSRDTLARALFRLGRFDDALEEQRRALEDAPEEQKQEYESYLRRLTTDIATWRDESGALRQKTIEERILDLEREISTLEQPRRSTMDR